MKRFLILAWFLSLPVTAFSSPVEAAVMEAKLKDIRFTSFSVKDVPLSGFIEILKKRTQETVAEQSPPAVAPIKFTVVPPALPGVGEGNHPPLTVSFDGRDVTLETILREVAKSSNQDIFLTSIGIVMTPKGSPPFPNSKSEKGEIFRKLTSSGQD